MPMSVRKSRAGPDGAIYVQTLDCGVERITDVHKDEPTSKLAYALPGSLCGVPTTLGHYLIQSVPQVVPSAERLLFRCDSKGRNTT